MSEIQSCFLNSVLENQVFSEIKNPILIEEQDKNLYQEAIFTRLITNLRKTFFISHALLGEELFYLIAHQFIRQYPSHEANLLDFGNLFHEFLLVNNFDQAHPFLSDLARFEWTWHLVFHGPNNSLHNFKEVLLKIEKQQGNAHLTLPDGAQLLRLNYPVDELLSDYENEKSFTFPSLKRKCYLLFQENEKMRVETLKSEEYLFLKIVEKVKTLEEVCFFLQTFTIETAIDSLFLSLCKRGLFR